MQKFYSFIALAAFSLFVIGLNAQVTISIDPNPSSIDFDDFNAWEHVAYGTVTNTSDETKTFVWSRNVVNITPGWESGVCDPILCHGWNTNNEVFELAAGASGALDVHVYPMGIVGGALIEVMVSEQGNWDNTLTGTYYFNQSVSVAERINDNISLFPNPASDVINIDNAEKVFEIEIFDLTGKRVIQEQLNGMQTVSVAHLPTGTYIARLFNNQNEQISINKVVIR